MFLRFRTRSDDEELFRITDDAFAFGQLVPHIKEVRVPYGSVAMRYAVKAGLKVVTFPCSTKKFGNRQKYEYVDDVFCCSGDILHEYFGQQDVVYVPEGIHSIDSIAFRLSKIKRIYLPSSVKMINVRAFEQCKQLEEIIGIGVEKIERHAFNLCEKLKRAEFPNLKQCFDISFKECNGLERKNIIIPKDTEIIKEADEPWTCGCGYCHTTRTPFTEIKVEKELMRLKRNMIFDIIPIQFTKELEKKNEQ